MSLVREIEAEWVEMTGLRPQPEWTAAIESAISACGEMPERGDRSRVLGELAKRVTVPETHFFRNQAQLSFCAEHARKTAGAHRPAQVWCAGSATGEEPYTIGLLLAQGGSASVTSVAEITASDINPEAVEKARAGRYTSWSFRGAPLWSFAHFRADGPRFLSLANQGVRSAVEFTVESCQEGASRRADASLDVILFRNVAIYLSDTAIRELHRQFARLLRPGGILAIGPSDPRPVLKEFEFESYLDDAPVFVRSASVSEERGLLDTEVSPLKAPRRGSEQSVKSRAEQNSKNRADRSPASSSVRREPVPRPAAECIDAAVHLAEGPPQDTVGHRILGQVHLSCGEAELAAAAFRQAVFLDGTDVLSRYFYALALRESGSAEQAQRQLRNTVSDLKGRSPEQLLMDGETSAAELLQSAQFLEAQWA